MIYSELRNFLVQASSPETVANFDNAIKVFDTYGMPDYMNMFDAVTFDAPNASDADTVDALHLNLRTVLEHLLEIQAITVHEDVLTSDVIAMLEAMAALPDYEDQATLSRILELEVTSNELAAELLALLMPKSVDEIMPLLDTVSDSFKEIFEARLRLKSGDEEPVDVDVKKYVEAYRTYKTTIDNEAIYPDKLLLQPAAIGLEYKSYIDLYRAEALGSQDAKVVAKELIGLAILAKDGVDAPLLAVRRHLTELFGDVRFLTDVNIAASNLSVGVAHAQA